MLFTSTGARAGDKGRLRAAVRHPRTPRRTTGHEQLETDQESRSADPEPQLA
jgi:hypothetical protein